jgi:hypothetical protein
MRVHAYMHAVVLSGVQVCKVVARALVGRAFACILSSPDDAERLRSIVSVLPSMSFTSPSANPSAIKPVCACTDDDILVMRPDFRSSLLQVEQEVSALSVVTACLVPVCALMTTPGA